MGLGNSSASAKVNSTPFFGEMEGIYTETTHSIKVTVRPIYIEEQSSPLEDHYVWAYHVNIENHGKEIVQLRARSWQIIDSYGHRQEVYGSGVVGELPVLNPGEVFEYTSGASLTTPSGMMYGQYEMVDGGGQPFKVTIPAFSLDSPYQPITLN